MNSKGLVFLSLAMMAPTAACTNDEIADPAEKEKKAVIHEYAASELTLDCTLGFETLSSNAIAMDGMELITETDEQVAYMAGPASFTMTKPGHYAHPTIFRRDIVATEDDKVAVKMAACGFGTKNGFDKIVERFEHLNAQYEFQQNVDITIQSGAETTVSVGSSGDPDYDSESELTIELEGSSIDSAETPEENAIDE